MKKREFTDEFEILIDTREKMIYKEKPVVRYFERVAQFNCGFRREVLQVGDYTAECKICGRTRLIPAAVERKQDINEIALNLTRDFWRFKKEFEIADNLGIRIYLLIENTNYADFLAGNYETAYYTDKDEALNNYIYIITHYNVVPVFCNQTETGGIIQQILEQETTKLKESYEIKEKIKTDDNSRKDETTTDDRNDFIISFKLS